MQILPDWLAIGRKPGRAAAASLVDRLGDPSFDDPLTAAEAMHRELPGLLAAQVHQPARLKLLETLFEKTRQILPGIERQLEAAPLPLPADALQAALAADNLLKIMAAGYSALLATVRAQNVPAASSNAGRLSTLRTIECLTRRQQLACRAYARASDNTWRLIHQTYAYAHQQNLTGFASGGRSIEHEYLLAVLLGQADPTKFSREDFRPLLGCLIHYAPLAKVRAIGSEAIPIDDEAPIFLIIEGDGHPGKRLTKPERTEAGKLAWLVDCRTMLAALDLAVTQRARGSRPLASEPVTPLPVLQTVLNCLRKPQARRFGRQSFKPRGDLIGGLPALFEALAGGRLTDHSDTSEWAIIDESPDGFGLRYLRGESKRLQVGELVGVRPRERDRRLHVCVIRRVVNSGPARFELGLQELSPLARPVDFSGPPGAAGRGILFPTLPAWGGVAGIIATAGAIGPGSRIPDGEGRQLVARRTLEYFSRYELWLLTEQ